MIPGLGLFSGLKFWFTIGVAGFIMLTVWFGYRYVTNMQTRIIELEKSLVLTENALKESNKTIDLININIKKMEELRKNLDSELAKTTQEIDDLRDLFAEHSLERLATAKPGLIEKRINDASDKALTDIERLTITP